MKIEKNETIEVCNGQLATITKVSRLMSGLMKTDPITQLKTITPMCRIYYKLNESKKQNHTDVVINDDIEVVYG